MITTLDRVKSVISGLLNVTEASITEESSLVDLGADSLDTFEILFCLEEEFLMNISEEDADGFNTVGNIVKYIESRL